MTAGPLRANREPFLNDYSLKVALGAVTTPDGIQASSSSRFKGAIFGRDSLEVGLDVVDHLPALALRILITVARHIGVIDNPESEEQPGKGFHEHRSSTVKGVPVAKEQLDLLRYLADKWGGTPDSVTYFGATDTGALYLKLLGTYCAANGEDVLNEEFTHARTGKTMTVAETVQMSAEWYVKRQNDSDIGLVEFKHTNPEHHWFQLMRDGHDGMVAPDGVQANPDAPIAAIEVQSVAHAGLVAAAQLTKDAGLAKRWIETANALRENTFERMWRPDVRYFGRAIHRRRDNGAVELITTLDTAVGEMLRDSMFDDLTDVERQNYVGSIAEMLYSDEFLLEIGFRMMAKRHLPLYDYWAYQGPNVTWPPVVKRLADGFHNQGLGSLATDADRRLLQPCEQMRDFPEFFFVDDDGTPAYRLHDKEGRAAIAPHPPQSIQAWTASAAFGAFSRPPAPRATGWQAELEHEISERLCAPFTFNVDWESGEEAERRFFATHSAVAPGFQGNWENEAHSSR